jgi:hypothetical protein
MYILLILKNSFMKTKSLIIILAVLLLSANVSYAQNFSNLDTIQLQEKSDYSKNDSVALACANFLLNTPVDVNDANRNNSARFLIRWMSGTPDYTFNIDESVGKVTQSNSMLLGIFLASATKYMLENKEQSKDANAVKFNSFLIYAQYCENPSNKLEQTKEIKKLIKAKDSNTLREYLKIK